MVLEKLDELKTKIKSENQEAPLIEAAIEKAFDTVCEKDIEKKIVEIQTQIVQMAKESDRKNGRALSEQTSRVFKELFKGAFKFPL